MRFVTINFDKFFEPGIRLFSFFDKFPTLKAM